MLHGGVSMPTACAASAGNVVFNELSTKGHGWVELRNSGSFNVSLQVW